MLWIDKNIKTEWESGSYVDVVVIIGDLEKLKDIAAEPLAVDMD